MRRWKSRRGVAVLAAYLLTGAFILQLGPCLSMVLNTGASAFDAGTLLDDNGVMFGLFAPCGRPNIQSVDENGFPITEILNEEDDLIHDCPITRIVVGGG